MRFHVHPFLPSDCGLAIVKGHVVLANHELICLNLVWQITFLWVVFILDLFLNFLHEICKGRAPAMIYRVSSVPTASFNECREQFWWNSPHGAMQAPQLYAKCWLRSHVGSTIPLEDRMVGNHYVPFLATFGFASLLPIVSARTYLEWFENLFRNARARPLAASDHLDNSC